MRRADVAAVLAIERAAFATPWSGATFSRLLSRENARMLVLEEEGRVAGYAVLWLGGREAQLGNLAVAPARRGRGHGRRLLGEAVDAALQAGIEALFLEVREGNVAARRLYEAEGFDEVARHPGYYDRPPEDAVVMRRPLGRSAHRGTGPDPEPAPR